MRFPYNFYYDNIFITQYSILDNDPSTNLTLKLSTGNHTITTVLLDVNDYATCINLTQVNVVLQVNNTRQLLNLVDEYLTETDITINMTDDDVSSAITSQVNIISTMIDYSDESNLNDSEVEELVNLQQQLLENVVILNNVQNITLDNQLSLVTSLEVITTPIKTNNKDQFLTENK